jgi:hypothetical protein
MNATGIGGQVPKPSMLFSRITAESTSFFEISYCPADGFNSILGSPCVLMQT